MPELMKFPRVAAFHWIFPLGPLTFWWSVNSAQRPRNSQCSHENMNEPARVFQSSFLGEGVVSDLPGVWKCEIMSELYSLVDGSKNTDQSRLLKNRKSLTWHYWHHSALTGISDVPVNIICQFGVMDGKELGSVFKFKIPVVLGLVLLEAVFRPTCLPAHVTVVGHSFYVDLSRAGEWGKRCHFKSNWELQCDLLELR